VTAELDIRLEDPVSTNTADESFTNLTFTVELQSLYLSLLKTLKGKKHGAIIIKPVRLMIVNT